MWALVWKLNAIQLVLLLCYPDNELMWKSEEFLLDLLVLKLHLASLHTGYHTTLFLLFLVTEV